VVSPLDDKRLTQFSERSATRKEVALGESARLLSTGGEKRGPEAARARLDFEEL